MGYITNNDILQRLGAAAYVQLTDDDGDGVADAGVVDEARLAAEGELDSYLARRYRLPLDMAQHSELADLLGSVALDVAEYRLRLRRPPAPRETTERFEKTILWLTSVAEGFIHLPAVSALTPTNVTGTVADSVGETRILSHDELSRF